MTTLSSDDVRHIAHLARIGVSDEDVARYQKDLSAVLDYFQKLQEVDTETVPPIEHIAGVENMTRADRISDCPEATRAAIMRNVPDAKEGYIKVKAIL